MRTRTRRMNARAIQYGLTVHPVTGAAVEDWKQQAVIDRIIRERVTMDWSFKAIADMLNDEAIPPARGKRWHPSAVRNIWDNATNGRVAQVAKNVERGAKEVREAVERTPEMVEFRQRHDPDYQFAINGYYDEQYSDINTATGEVTGGTQRWDSKEKWDHHLEQDAEQLARGRVATQLRHS